MPLITTVTIDPAVTAAVSTASFIDMVMEAPEVIVSWPVATSEVASHWLTGTAAAPIVDGDTSDPVWRNIQPFSLMTNQGGNFDGRGESRVEIRAVHDGTWAYVLFTG